MILLTLLPELNLNKLTSPEYTIHTAGLEYLSWGKTVKHREHKAQGLFFFSLNVYHKKEKQICTNKENGMKGLKVTRSSLLEAVCSR